MVDMKRDARALIVDDEPDIRELLAITLDRMNIDTAVAADLAEARELLGQLKPDLCLTDMRLPDGDGLELVDWIQQHQPSMPVAVITAHGNVEAAVDALKRGAFDFVSKPLDIADLRRLVDTALKLGKPEPLADADPSRPQLLGKSPTIQRVRELVAKVARSQAPVHISGESGTGKELAARLIHDSGPRADKPFIPVNCGAIPSELMESEFFGHRKGSFTGAHADKEGLFQAADGGTLFLDEVADLPLHMQVKLLRVIQEKAIRPVGASREVSVNVRILSATHRDLHQLVARGEFREDLFYRINVIEVHIPALRERREDIEPLLHSLLSRLADNLGMPQPTLTADALEKIRAHPFPGNVRELENVLERAMTLSTDDVIDADDIQLRKLPKTEHDPTPADEPANGIEGVDALPRHLGDNERQAILEALQKARYNKTRAAGLLGLTLRQLRYRIEKLGIDD
jgi:two-component system response regulator PilR (NtrC family)